MRSLAVVRAGHAPHCAPGAEPPEFDLECPLLSLPAVFQTTVETAPWPGAYLGADPELVFQKRLRFQTFAPFRFATAITPSAPCAWAWPGLAIHATRRIASGPCLWPPCCRCCALRHHVDFTAERAGSRPVGGPSRQCLCLGRVERRQRPGRNGGARGHAGPGHYYGHLHRAPGRGHGQAGVDSAALS